MHENFIKFGRMLFEQGLNNSHSGNMSRRDGNHIYVTAHGARLGDLTSKDIVKVSLKDDRKDKEASFEVKVHRAIYLACPDIKAIVHAHTPYGIVLSLKQKHIKPVDAEGAYYLPSIPVLCCKETIGSDEVADRLPTLIGKHKAVLIKGHGAFAGGKDLEQATLLASVLESVCRIIHLSRQFKQNK